MNLTKFFYEKKNTWSGKTLIKVCKIPVWNKRINSSFNDNLIHVAFDIKGGVGDFVNHIYYIKAFKKYFGNNVVIDILSEKNEFDLKYSIFNKLDFINNITINEGKKIRYDVLIQIVRFPLCLYYFRYRLSKKLSEYCELLVKFYQENTILYSNDFLGRCYAKLKGQNRKTQSDINNILGVKDIKFEFPKLENVNKIKETNYITIQTGSGLHFKNIKNEVRQWPIKYYEELCLLIKKNYPKYKIVQIGSGYQSKIKNADINLLGKTTFSELITILKYSKLHISQEGGLVFLRNTLCSGNSVVLFGPTDEDFFGIKGNINISSRKCPVCCEWLTNNWFQKCIKTGKCAECMQNISPEFVFEKIKNRKVL